MEDRIRLVIERKDHQLREKEEELKDISMLSKELTHTLDEYRRQDIDFSLG